MGLSEGYEVEGGYIDSLPEHLRASYLKSRNDPQLEGLKHESTVLATLIKVRMGDLGEDAPRMRWAKALELLTELEATLPEEYDTEVGMLRRELEAVRDYATAEKEIRKLVQERAVVVTVESQRLQRLKQFISREAFMFQLGRIAGAARVAFQLGIAQNRSLPQVRDDFLKAIASNAPDFAEGPMEEVLIAESGPVLTMLPLSPRK